MIVVVTLSVDPQTGAATLLGISTRQDGVGSANGIAEGVGGGQNGPPPPPVAGALPFGPTEQEALAALKALGVNGAEKLARQFTPGRILEVCRVAKTQAKRNVPGWIRFILTRGYGVV